MRLFRNRKATKGSNHNIHISKISHENNLKILVNILDKVGNLSADVQLLISRELSKLGIVPEFNNAEFGSNKDCYRVLSFIESAYLALDSAIKKTIEEEKITRLTIIENERLYTDLTSMSLDSEQASILAEYDKVIQDGQLGMAKNLWTQEIIEGYKAEKIVLTNEDTVHKARLQKEHNRKDLAVLQNTNFKSNLYSDMKNHYSQQTRKEPDLSRRNAKLLQTSLDSTARIENGVSKPTEVSK